MELLGRRAECEALDQLLADALDGRSRVMVLRGEAGIGKSALLAHLSEPLEQWHVARAVGVESEIELDYSGLHQLCAPMLGHLTTLPVPQRDALAIVFGRSAGPTPDRFLVGLATLTLFAEVAEHQPLACIVDDAQWLDQASAQIIGFVSRRLLAERVAVVCAARSGIGDHVLAGLPELPVHGLSDSDGRALLLHHMHGQMDAAVRDQIVAESHGNPLALLELPRTWSLIGLAGGFGVPDSPVAGKIEQSYLRRLLVLPSETQLIVLAAAAEPLGDPVLLHRAAATLGLDMTSADAAVAAGLLTVGEHVAFAHPLARSAIYGSAAADDRRRVHGALAAATNAETDPDRRAWHSARATRGPNEGVAAQLERSAGRARSRGGLAAAAAFLTRATELTPAPTQRVRRALDAAFASLQAGAFDAARAMLALTRDGPIDQLQRARVDLLRAQLALASSRGSEATPLLLAAARRLESLDLELARETYVDAFTAALFGANLNETVGVREVARAARAAPRRSDTPSVADLLLDAFAALADDYATAVPLCREALQRLCGDQLTREEKLRWFWHGIIIALELWDGESASYLSQQYVQVARKAGALSELERALSTGPVMLAFSGELASATSLVVEAQSVQEATGTRTAPYGALKVAAWRGQARKTRELIEFAVRDAASRGEGSGVAFGEYTHAVLCNGLAEYEEALGAACRASEHQQIVIQNWGLTELIEPATRTGRGDLAAGALEKLSTKAQASRTDWALGIEARSRALLSDGSLAESHFHRAIEHLGRTRVRAELGRTRLLYGEWLRRSNRRGDARNELTVAYEMFNEIGMEGFAERTRRELVATGATVRKRRFESRDDLTGQEAQIALLARDGLSNPEIGAQLFISGRTVEWHLHKVFSKLGISSRRQLRDALPADVLLIPSA